MELLKLLSANEIIAQVLSFLILLWLLRIFAWKRILSLLDARRERIALEFKRIEDGKQEIAKLKSDYEIRLSSIEETADRKIDEAIARGREITEEVRKKAHEEAQDIINDARRNIKYELDKAKEELKDQVVDLTIKATENLIQEKFTEDDDAKMIKNFLDTVDKAE